MSALTCPVCQGAMREVERQGVLIDTCTQCRGVWLDRGELEKLAGALGGPSAQPFAAAEPQTRPPLRREYFGEDEENDDRYGRTPQSRMSRLLDFFD